MISDGNVNIQHPNNIDNIEIDNIEIDNLDD